MGSVHATLKGAGAGPSLMLSAHMDEIGLMVTYISDEGYLSVASVGGVDAAVLPGMRVDVHASESAEPLRGVVGRKPIHLIEPDERRRSRRWTSWSSTWGFREEGAQARARGRRHHVRRGLRALRRGHGRVARVRRQGGRLGGRARAGAAGARRPCARDFTFAATVQEEIGTRGAETSAYSVRPRRGARLDVTHATDYPGIDPTKHGKIVCGQGPVIARPQHQPRGVRAPGGRRRGRGPAVPAGGRAGRDGHRRRAHPDGSRRHPHGPRVGAAALHAHAHRGVCLPTWTPRLSCVVRFARDLGEDACFVPGMAGASPLAREEAADDAELAAQAAAGGPAHETAAQRRFDETGVE